MWGVVQDDQIMTSARDIITMALRRLREGRGPGGYSAGRRLPMPPLHEWLGDIPFVLVGGLATRLYMPERMTLDVDILLAAGDEGRVAHRLRQAGFQCKGPLMPGGSSWVARDGQVLDVLVLDRPWVKEAISKPVKDEHSHLPVISLPFLVLMKLESGRTQDFADIARMMGQADLTARDRVRKVVDLHRPQDSEDLESLITLGQTEMGRPTPGPSREGRS